MEIVQSNIYYYEMIKWYIVSIQELCLQKTYQDVPRKSGKTCHKSLDSCACTRFLCMHNTLVHAQHSCACTGGARAQGRDPKKSSRPGPDLRQCFCWVPALGPGPSSACTRVLCMHKNIVHAIFISMVE